MADDDTRDETTDETPDEDVDVEADDVDEEFDEEDEELVVDPIEADEDLVDAVVDVEAVGDVDPVAEVKVEEEAVEEPVGARPRVAGEDDEEDEDEPDPDDVEEDLDTILKDRIAATVVEEDDEDEDALPVEAPTTEAGGRVQPKRPGEFTCQSCFLVKNPSQLADGEQMLCADCV